MNIDDIIELLNLQDSNLVEIAVLNVGTDAVCFEDATGNECIMYRRNDKGEVGIVRVESREEESK